MFTRLRRGLPVLVPHQGLVATSYGHVDELCAGLLTLGRHPAAVGEVVQPQRATASPPRSTWPPPPRSSGSRPTSSTCPTTLLAGLAKLPFSHLFAARHHGIVSTEKARRLLDLPAGALPSDRAWPRRTSGSCGSPLAEVDDTIADPLWGAGFDLAHEAEVAAGLRP